MDNEKVHNSLIHINTYHEKQRLSQNYIFYSMYNVLPIAMLMFSNNFVLIKEFVNC